jgi:hypothetical protein
MASGDAVQAWAYALVVWMQDIKRDRWWSGWHAYLEAGFFDAE